MSGASEATLQELLQVNRDMASAISKLAGASGGSGGSGSGGSGPAGKAAGALGKTFEGLGKGAGMITGIFGTMMKPALMAASAGFNLLTSSGKALIANQMQLAEGAIQGTNSLASLTAGLEQLPGILGLAMKAYNYQIKKLEANVKTYQDISQVGARFGGSLDEVRRSAANTYLSMDEFAQVMKSAGPNLRYMGETSEEGAKNLVKFNSTLIKGEVGKGLLGMGYTLQEVNGLIGDYASAMGGLKASQLKDQREMEKTVKSFAEELDASAQLEGKTRQQKLEEMKKENQNSAVQAKLSEMNEQQRLKYQQAMDRAKSQGEKEYIQSLLLGVPPMTKAGQQYAAMNAAGAEALTDSVAAIESNTSAAQERERIDRNGFKSSNALAETYKNNKTAMNALSLGTGNLSDAAKAAAQSYADQKNSGIDTEEKSQARMAKIYSEQEKAQKSGVGAIVQAQGAAKHAGGIMDMLYAALKPLIDIILVLNEKFLEVLPAIAQFTADVINKGLVVLTSIFKAIDWSAVKTSFMGAWKMLTETFGNIYDAVGKAVGGSGGIGGLLSKGMTMFFDTMKSIIEVVGVIVVKFVQSNLFQTLKTFMLSMWGLIKVLVDAVVEIVKSPVGMFVIDVIFDTFDILFTIVNKLIEGVKAAVTLIVQVVKSVTTDFSESWKKIKDYVMNLINTVSDWFKSIPKKINDFFGEGNLLEKVFDALKGIIGGIVDGIKAIGSKIVNFFKSSDATPSGPTAPQTANAPNASNMPPMTETAKKMAEENAKKNASTVTANNNGNVPVVQPKSNDPVEILRAEIQTLNNITSEMLKAMRDTRDYSKSTANTLASNGNLFKRA
jgi:hypothetical protein